MKASPANTTNWQALNPVLERCYQGVPQGRSGIFPGTVFTLVKLLKGQVMIEKDGYSISTDAREDRWIICVPGTRTQQFSDDALIYSIHLSLGNPQNGAEWTGRPIICPATTAAAERALCELLNCTALAKLSSEQRLNLRAIEMPCLDYLALQTRSLTVLHWALYFANQNDMRYEVPRIQDTRVRASHRDLASLEIHKEFDRHQLAAREGLTASQLDRLWRKELGITPNQYRNRQRLTYACEQLRRPEIPIKVIAAELGFRHLSQFSNWFHTRHRESPRNYRQRPSIS